MRMPVILTVVGVVAGGAHAVTGSDDPFDTAAKNADDAGEAFRRAHAYMEAWLARADPETGLIPRNLSGDAYWNAQDAAADNYAFMVLTAAMTDRDRLGGVMRTMLESERRLTSRLGPLPDDYAFDPGGFRHAEASADRITFGVSEYVKDGLMPVLEWLGPGTPWYDRQRELVDALWTDQARMESDRGESIICANPDPSALINVEAHGDNLQVLPRLYWCTGDRMYLDRAVRLGDHYLLGDHHPTNDMARLRLRDHGNEILGGLAELYATVSYADPGKADAYRAPMHRVLDRVLEVGRNEHGLFYNDIDPRSGRVLDGAPADTFGYVLDAYYTVYLIDRDSDDEAVAERAQRYREAARTALGALPGHYRSFAWEGASADGYADAIEGALNLFNREPVPGVAGWIDSEIRVMWSKQRAEGIVEGWHGDGNFARTSLMYALWKTRGLTIDPWRLDVKVGAVEADGDLCIHLTAEDEPWAGRLVFDHPRHRDHLHLPMDWPRINQWPQWFTVDAEGTYIVSEAGTTRRIGGEDLTAGLELSLRAGVPRRISIRASADGGSRTEKSPDRG